MADGSPPASAGAGTASPPAGAPAPRPISAPRVWMPGEVYRPVIKQIIQAWRWAQPAEAARFYRRAADWRKWLQNQGPAVTARKTQWCPVFSFPVRIVEAIARQLTPDGATELIDWMADPVILKVVIEELGAAKLVRNPGSIR